MGNCISQRVNLYCHSRPSDTSSDLTRESRIIQYTPHASHHSLSRAPGQRSRLANNPLDHGRSSNKPVTALPSTTSIVPTTKRSASDPDSYDILKVAHAKPAESFETYFNGGYWPLWRRFEEVLPSCIRLDALTHIHYAFANINEDGTVSLPEEKLACEVEKCHKQIASLAWGKHRKDHPNLKITLAIGGGSESIARTFAEMCISPHKRFTFIRSVRSLVDKFSLDGVDIDWEYPSGNLGAKLYLKLLIELRQGLGWHRWLTTALPAGLWALQKLDLQQIAKVVDFINLMAYDFVGPTFANARLTGHHAQLYCPVLGDENTKPVSAATAVEYLIERGVPSRKIMLGVPTYGRCFRGALAPGEPFDGPGSGNDATHEVKDLPRPGMIETFDESLVAAYASGNGEFITYDNKECVREKAEYVKQKNLRGLFYWHLAGDRTGDDSLIEAGHRVLMGGKVP